MGGSGQSCDSGVQVGVSQPVHALRSGRWFAGSLEGAGEKEKGVGDLGCEEQEVSWHEYGEENLRRRNIRSRTGKQERRRRRCKEALRG